MPCSWKKHNKNPFRMILMWKHNSILLPETEFLRILEKIGNVLLLPDTGGMLFKVSQETWGWDLNWSSSELEFLDWIWAQSSPQTTHSSCWAWLWSCGNLPGQEGGEREGNEGKCSSTMQFWFLAEGQGQGWQNNHEKAAKVVRSCGHSWNHTMLAQGFIISWAWCHQSVTRTAPCHRAAALWLQRNRKFRILRWWDARGGLRASPPQPHAAEPNLCWRAGVRSLFLTGDNGDGVLGMSRSFCLGAQKDPKPSHPISQKDPIPSHPISQKKIPSLPTPSPSAAPQGTALGNTWRQDWASPAVQRQE